MNLTACKRLALQPINAIYLVSSDLDRALVG
jgi:hypothetical protein